MPNIEIHPYITTDTGEQIQNTIPLARLKRDGNASFTVGDVTVQVKCDKEGVIRICDRIGDPWRGLPTFLDTQGSIIVFPKGAIEIRIKEVG